MGAPFTATGCGAGAFAACGRGAAGAGAAFGAGAEAGAAVGVAEGERFPNAIRLSRLVRPYLPNSFLKMDFCCAATERPVSSEAM